MGTEHVGPLLYSIVSMLRPSSVLEVGAGYTTLFLAQALADAAAEARGDRNLIRTRTTSDRADLLSARAADDYQPHLYVIDNLRHPHTSAGRVPEALARLGLSDHTQFIDSRFAGASDRLPPRARPLDFVWFDCGAAQENGMTFLEEYWPLLRVNGGVLALHSMHVPIRTGSSDRAATMVPSALLNELSRRHAEEGRQRAFEILSLVEPHKAAQGDLTLIRKLGPLDAIRTTDGPFAQLRLSS